MKLKILVASLWRAFVVPVWLKR